MPNDRQTVDVAEILGESFNGLPEETLNDALQKVQAKIKA